MSDLLNLKPGIKKFLIYLFLISIVFIIDRVSKILILNILNDKEKVDIYINSFLNFYLVWNSGVGFGLLSADQFYIYHTITLFIILINIVIIYLIYKENNYKSYFFLMILGGSLGNLFDRIYYRAVPDFIDFNYKGFHWFIFNVADIFITIGIICLIFAELLNYKSNDEKK